MTDRPYLATTGERFKAGDKVFIVRDLGPLMPHFPANREAIVLHSAQQKYGPELSAEQYALAVPGHGYVSWYPGCYLEPYDLVKHS